MAIPFLLPNHRDCSEDYQDLDRLLSDLFHVLARILAQRGESVAVLSTGAVTIRRPTRQLRLQVSDQTQVDDEVDVIEVSSAEESFSDDSVPPSPTSPTAPIPELPDLVSNLPAALAERLPEVRAVVEAEEQSTRAQPVRSRSRKPRSSPRKARSPRGSRAKRSAASLTSPSKDLTRTPSNRVPKAAPTVY